jgi:iron complex outermembrane recepter protein
VGNTCSDAGALRAPRIAVAAIVPGATRSKTFTAILLSLAMGCGSLGLQAVRAAEQSAEAQQLETVIVTGSLIPQFQAETATPVTVITAEDLQSRGFASVADALQHGSFATGSVQGPQDNFGFTPGAQTLSLFGLNPGYVKYLIDGRPIADYPALYNGTDIIVSISGIPTVMVDHIDILPGGQSSIYGSDAIAGVINIILKKKLDAPVVDVRYGFTQDGGGTSRRIGLADSFAFGGVNLMAGGQYERTDPIWGYQRDLTKQYFTAGTTPQTAERDFLVFGLFGDPTTGNTYYFEDPASCANVAGQFNGTTRLYSRPARGDYCGTTSTGYATIGNGEESTQGYLHVTDDLTDHVQLLADVLVTHDVIKYNTGPGFFETDFDSTSPFYYYEDPSIPGDYLNLQRIFSPEEAGGLNKIYNKNTNNGVRAILGIQGSFGASDWTYNADWTYTQNKLTERTHFLFTSGVENFFSGIMGPSLGQGPLGDTLFTPNYAALYTPITPAQYASFSGFGNSYSQTEDSLLRGQLTNARLFPLPGGHAGIALVVEGGDQGWKYNPDPRFLSGEAFNYTATAGSGHRSRYAVTTEVRLPVLKMLTFDASGRYDNYRVAGANVSKATYNLGLEFRPTQAVLLRGRYGTAFKAPTLSDQFQGASGFFETLTDYYTCAKSGFTGGNLGNCPQAQVDYFGTTQGNPALKPITAKVWDLGMVFTPVERLSVSVDFIHWSISNEVNSQDANTLLKTESACRLGTLDITSPTCVAAISQVTRDPDTGALVSFFTPKQNLASEILNVFTLGASYKVSAGRIGNFEFEAAWSDTLKHTTVQFPGDPTIDALNYPLLYTDFKTKANASVTWIKEPLSATVYVERYGRTPNNLATINGYGTDRAGTLGSWSLCNLSARYQLLSSLELSAVVDNLFNRAPPIDNSYSGLDNIPYNTDNYNVYGRSFFLEANYHFGK